MLRTLSAALLALSLAGCIAHAPETPSAAPTGTPGAPGEPGRGANPAPGFVREQIRGQDFLIDSARPGAPIAIQVPAGADRILLSLDYRSGAYQDAGFTLGACRHVSPVIGVAAGAAGAVASVGSTSTGVLYDCGHLDPGAQSITWSLTGVLEGRIQVYADVPA